VTTHREKQLLDHVTEHVRVAGVVPTYREIQRAMNYKSVNSVATLIDSLIKQGVLRRQRGKYMKQNIVLTGQCPACGRGP